MRALEMELPPLKPTAVPRGIRLIGVARGTARLAVTLAIAVALGFTTLVVVHLVAHLENATAADSCSEESR